MVEPDSLVLEYLRAIRVDMAKMLDRMNTMSAEMNAVRRHPAGVWTIAEHDHDEIGVMKTRLDRVEKRLGLAD
jgi:hypothetical protein